MLAHGPLNQSADFGVEIVQELLAYPLRQPSGPGVPGIALGKRLAMLSVYEVVVHILYRKLNKKLTGRLPAKIGRTGPGEPVSLLSFRTVWIVRVAIIFLLI